MQSRKESLKTVAKTILFLLILVLLFFSVQAVLTPKWRYVDTTNRRDEGDTDKYGLYYSLPQNTVDYIVLGVSHSYNSVNPMLIYGESGITGYDLGSSAQSMELSYYWLKEALKTQSPSAILLDIATLLRETQITNAWVTRSIVPMKFSMNKVNAILDCKTDSQTFWELMLPIIQFHGRWTGLSKGDFFVGNDPDYIINGAYISFLIKMPSEKTKRIPGTEYAAIELTDDFYTVYEPMIEKEIQEDQVYYFERILELCQRNSIDLIPFKAPTMNWSAKKSEVMNEFLQQYELELLDLTDNSLVQIVWSKDTGDTGSHTNYWGSAKTSYFLAGYLKERGIPDHRGQTGYEVWDDTLQKYRTWEERRLQTTQQAAYSYLNALSKAKDDSLIIVSVKDEATNAWNDTLEAAMRDLGVNSSFYGQEQNSFVVILDAGENVFEKWDDHRITVNANYPINDSRKLRLSISSAGYMCGNLSSITVNGTNYSRNGRGLNIVVIDKQTGTVISSASIDTFASALTFNQKSLPEAQSAVWEEKYAASQIVEDGVYNIIPSADPGCAIDVPYGDTGDNVNIWLSDKNGLTPQEFEFEHIGSGLYTIRSVCSDKYLAIEDMGSTSGSNVVQQTYSGLANQKWFITKNMNGSFSFTSLYNRQVLDVPYGAVGSEANIWVVGENFKTPQQFFLEKVQ